MQYHRLVIGHVCDSYVAVCSNIAACTEHVTSCLHCTFSICAQGALIPRPYLYIYIGHKLIHVQKIMANNYHKSSATLSGE